MDGFVLVSCGVYVSVQICLPPSRERVTKLNVQLYNGKFCKICAVSCAPKSLSPTTCIIALRNADIGLLVEPNLFTQSAYYMVSIAFECGSHLETYFAMYRAHAVISTITCKSILARQFWSIN